MKLELVKAIVILPGTALVYVPGAILWLSAGTPLAMAPAGSAQATFWIGLLLAGAGFVLPCGQSGFSLRQARARRRPGLRPGSWSSAGRTAMCETP